MTKLRAKKVLETESAAIKKLIGRIDDNFLKAVAMICKSKGRVVVTGMGKAGIIGQKISATLSSVGTPSLWLHSAEAIHGDLGRVTKDDVIMLLSNSGETDEVKRLLPLLKKIGAKVIAMTGNLKSTLAKHSDVTLDVSVKEEGCPLGLAPMASTTAMLAMGDALSACLIERKGFRREDFAFLHPGGNLGKKLLLKVEDIMRKAAANPVVNQEKRVKDVLLSITQARAGSATIVNSRGKLVGIFTDGDLRRHLGKDIHLANRKVKEVMTKHPITISPGKLAVEALRILEERKIDEIPVVGVDKKPVGLLDIQDLLKAGLV